jgi:hypothetical protein
MATDKSYYNRQIKVSQSTIDEVKKMGMKKALAAAGKNPVIGGTEPKDIKQAETVEAVRRLYGQTRFMNAINKPKASPGPIGSASNVREGRSTAKTTGPKANEQNREPVKTAMTPRQKAEKDLAQSRTAKFNDPVSKRFPGRFGTAKGN